jgi:predicted nucleic acid-binding protein
MRRYLLDTPLLAALLNQRPNAVSLITPWVRSKEVSTSILVYGEVIEYIKRRPNYPQHYQGLRNLLLGIHSYTLTDIILERYADIRLTLGRGNLIGDIDTLIAATALERNLTVVTTDTDFQRVPNLKQMLIPRHLLRR